MAGLFLVDFNLIDEDPENPRGDVGDVTDLVIAIAERGQEDPIHVIPQGNGRYFLHEGHRRRKAMKELGYTGAKAIERHFASDLDRLLSQGQMHLHRKTFNPMAWSRYCYRLFSEFNLDREAIARKLGMSQGWVRDHLSFVHLTDLEQRALESGQITRAEALRRLAARRAERDGRQPAAAKVRNAGPAAAQPAPARIPAPREPAEPHLNAGHPLAELVAARCASRGADHADRPRIGTVGCGQCWEDAIRADALTTAPALVAA